MKNEKTSPVQLDPNLKKRFKLWCVKNNISIKKKLEELIEKHLEKMEKI